MSTTETAPHFNVFETKVMDVDVGLPISPVQINGIPVEQRESYPGLTIPDVDGYLDLFDRLDQGATEETYVDSQTEQADEIRTTEKKTIPWEVDGKKTDIEVWTLPLNNPRIFDMLRAWSYFQPFVFVRENGSSETKFGTMSENRAGDGITALPSIKVLTVLEAPDFKEDRDILIPDIDTVMMISGSAADEVLGSGAHSQSTVRDMNHTMPALGSLSKGETTMLDEHGKERHHGVREASSTDFELSNGSLGRGLYLPRNAKDTFAGFDEPVILHRETVSPDARIFVPKKLATTNRGYGVYWNRDGDSAQKKLAKGLENVYDAHGRPFVSRGLKVILDEALHGL